MTILSDIEQVAVRVLPEPVKVLMRPLYNRVHYFGLYRRLFRSSKSCADLQRYWMRPYDSENSPERYLSHEARSQALLDVVNKFCTRDDRILEIGCNAGRNLHHLFLDGFMNLEGIEINSDAIRLLKETFIEMAKRVEIRCGSVESIIKTIKDSSFDLVFTMAVLQHIHPDSEFMFSEMVRIAKSKIITIEGEIGTSWNIFPRNYRAIFESLGMKQVYELNGSKLGNLKGYRLRVFQKQ